ncbi:MAG: hypothetical protein QM608_07860 [Caulobacter sp.]
MIKLSSFAAAAILVLPVQALAEPVKAAVKVFYCGELSDEAQATKLNYFRLGEGIQTATWMGVVRAPKVRPGPPPLSWCRAMMSQDVDPATCRQEGNPSVVSGALAFTVVETLIGAPTQEIEVAPEPGVRLLLNAEYRAKSSLRACRQANEFDSSGGTAYYSPTIVSLDPRREYVLLLKPGAYVQEGADPQSSPGVWAAAFALVQNGDRLRDELRQAVKAWEQHRREEGEGKSPEQPRP